MCGFVGGLYYEETAVVSYRNGLFQQANDLIYHRGPDDKGYYHDSHMSMAFRRLSIIDIENGHQPFRYDNGRYMIVFNGEIYNHTELREWLKQIGVDCETNSDTEVLVALYATIGSEVVERIRGMFSFLIWDSVEKTLFGARDHFGIKPLYYMDRQDGLFFASENKSLLPFINSYQLNEQSLQHYFAFQYVPEPSTMDTIIQKIPPGHYFVKNINEKGLKLTPYFKPRLQPKSFTHEVDEMKKIRKTLTESVEKHMRSDVPVGAFLSGGVDSTIIVSLAKRIQPKLKTFTVGFEYEKYSEVDVARKTADILGTDHTTVLIQPDEFIKELPQIIWHMDDPVADPAAIPLYFIAREARKNVTVVLSGEGADELFAGYNIYKEPSDLAMWRYIPSMMKKILLSSSSRIPDGVKGKSFIYRGCTSISDRYIGNAHIFKELDMAQLFKFSLTTNFHHVTEPIFKTLGDLDDVAKMQAIDLHTWLRGDILTKADRMTMANSLELRVPFLDKEVFQVASKLPTSSKINNGETKWILREAFKELIPEHIVNRRKLGFPVPIRIWLKNELYDWTVTLVNDSPTDNILNKQYIKQLLSDHAKGKNDNSRKLWTVITFLLWHRQFIEGQVPDAVRNSQKGTFVSEPDKKTEALI
ncbi:asparagine synthase (glutamine-hydrolyzing) [Metabacillus niabensis]|uniref:asparagine synthase (glutamine-hydrolyzing) n=2 Tax=Metabacillus niabensis TaxID=324854 RepID=A0ABT9YX31_9BACI|nr:asparagine synthase (glutamine-hydrolyzing) [Metabacillus niabensis]MDQ0224507.1 asparagine synthase (glutamine-hydrolyzing) [Metabacillus niabensis]